MFIFQKQRSSYFNSIQTDSAPMTVLTQSAHLTKCQQTSELTDWLPFPSLCSISPMFLRSKRQLFFKARVACTLKNDHIRFASSHQRTFPCAHLSRSLLDNGRPSTFQIWLLQLRNPALKYYADLLLPLQQLAEQKKFGVSNLANQKGVHKFTVLRSTWNSPIREYVRTPVEGLAPRAICEARGDFGRSTKCWHQSPGDLVKPTRSLHPMQMRRPGLGSLLYNNDANIDESKDKRIICRKMKASTSQKTKLSANGRRKAVFRRLRDLQPKKYSSALYLNHTEPIQELWTILFEAFSNVSTYRTSDRQSFQQTCQSYPPLPSPLLRCFIKTNILSATLVWAPCTLNWKGWGAAGAGTCSPGTFESSNGWQCMKFANVCFCESCVVWNGFTSQDSEEFNRSLSSVCGASWPHSTTTRGEVRYILTYTMGTAEQQHRRRAKADRACDVMLLFCGIVIVFVRPSCKSIYRVYIIKQANDNSSVPRVYVRKENQRSNEKNTVWTIKSCGVG